MNKNSRTSLFLMELIISILLFSITSAVCSQLFVQTHIIEKETKELSFAVHQTQNLAEVFLSLCGEDFDAFNQELTQLNFKQGPVTVTEFGDTLIPFYFDENFQPSVEVTGYIKITLSLSQDEKQIHAIISTFMAESETPLHRITVDKNR